MFQRFHLHFMCGDEVGKANIALDLVPALSGLLDRVDAREIGFTIGEALSYLAAQNQQIVENFFCADRRLGIDQRTADKLRELEDAGELTDKQLCETFLSSPVKPLKGLEREVERLYSKAAKVTTTIKMVPSGGSGERSLEAAIEAIDEIARRSAPVPFRILFA